MRLFKRIPRTPEYDPHLHDPDVYVAGAHLGREAWDHAAAIVHKRSDVGSRQFLVDGIAPETLEPWVDRWVAARPEEALPLLVRGITGIKWAWNARGGGRADSVKRDAWQVFWDRLQEADDYLRRAAELAPDDPIPAAMSMPIVRGLQMSQEELWARFTYVVERDRWNVGAHLQMVQSLAPKWSGSIRQLREFTSTVVEHAPEGHPVHCVEASAVIEEWVEAGEKRFFQNAEIRNRIHHAAERSLGSDAFGSGPDEATALNYFAFVFLRMKDREALLSTVNRIGAQITESPWILLGEPAEVYGAAFKYAHR